MRPSFPLGALALTALLAACSGAPPDPSPAPAPAESPAPPPTADRASGTLYAEAQAEAGRRVFQDRCAECHYSSEMRGTQFQFNWERRTVGDLYDHLVETMPEDAPGSLTSTEYVEVVAYILSLNGFPSGAGSLRVGGPAFEASLEAPSGAR